jgi:two-component system LytT family response regulator
VYKAEDGAAAAAIAQANAIDIFFLDMEIAKDFDCGLTLAMELRKTERYLLTPILFVTAYRDKKELSYDEVHCYAYITKPFKRELINRALSELIYRKKYESKESEPLVLKPSRAAAYSLSVYPGDIIFLEKLGKTLYIATKQEKLRFEGHSFVEVLKLLDERFVQCHKSFIVNVDYVESVDRKNNLLNMRGTSERPSLGRKYKFSFYGGTKGGDS